ncbi:hypothetical protein J6590_009471 [Homalodisca vitripennis]|nr:hypothetical protein J6590_009471 [Homalodisca vitripennis]
MRNVTLRYAPLQSAPDLLKMQHQLCKPNGRLLDNCTPLYEAMTHLFANECIASRFVYRCVFVKDPWQAVNLIATWGPHFEFCRDRRAEDRGADPIRRRHAVC